ncbi:hypothetical protein BGZ97_011898 [Linnemannia gamsii]|uniref:Uncharacterized protein n=1 Tax=Linnemannia gamsii TaxID=64522 RepID=A0A9P6UL92_9FUNG|nr:hypothetical protein BGZ97_011898 [Linnemannia gamsii]
MPETVDFYIKAVDLWIEQNSSVVSAGLNSVRSGAEMNPREIAKPFMEVYKRKLGALSAAEKLHGDRVTEGYNDRGFKRMMI